MDYELSSRFAEEENRWLVDISGEVDIFGAPDLRKQLLALIEKRQADILLNCAKLDYIDSTTLGTLVAVLRRVKEYSCSISLKNIKPSLLKLFKITDLDKVFDIKGDEDANN